MAELSKYEDEGFRYADGEAGETPNQETGGELKDGVSSATYDHRDSPGIDDSGSESGDKA